MSTLAPNFDPQSDTAELIRHGRKPARPRPAASLILVRFDDAVPRILLGRRAAHLRFMPGKYVFPGGMPHRNDSRAPFAGALATPPAHAGCDAVALRRLALAAIRETFEEVGLRFVHPHPDASRLPSPSLHYGPPRRRPLGGGKPPKGWRAFCADGHVPDLAPMRYLGRAVTPTILARRYDARFFWADAAPVLDQPLVPSDEFDHVVWATAAETADLPLPAVTRFFVAELESVLRDPAHSPVFLSARAGRSILVRA